MAFFNDSIENIFKNLDTSKNGIDEKTKSFRQEKFGKNELPKAKKIGFFKRFFEQFKNIMIIILLISAIISSASAIFAHDTENLFEGVLILVIVIVNAVVGVVQEQKAENALSSLLLVTENDSRVIRNGFVKKVKVHELVVGDIVLLKAGDQVPADVRIIECNNLKCNESSLTGESHSVSKNANTLKNEKALITEQTNMCFSGTSVTSGSGLGVVVAVGKHTELGKIANVINSNIKEKTPLEKNIEKIGKAITFFVLGITVVVFLIQVLLNKNITFFDALLTAVALAVAAIPESLPAVITIIMAMGVQKLARKNAIIKKLSAVETLGCCNIICADKTGTLTKNEMTVSHLFWNLQISKAKDFHAKETDSLTLTASLCNNLAISEKGSFVGDATECAIGKFLSKNKINFLKLKQKYEKLTEDEFDSTKKTMSITYRKNGEKFLFQKGALDFIIDNCKYIFHCGKLVPLSAELKAQVIKSNEAICENGERVIAFAMQNFTKHNGLVFVGFMGIVDPPKNESFLSVAECKKAGLKPIMITGDHPATAFAVAKKLKIAKSKNEVLTGADLNRLTTKELAKIISKYSVFARVTPEHKLMIVQALKQNGNIVAMTGDGVNDAPSVKLANIGVSMGINGTDVTKEVADIIISDDNFSTIVMAIKEGRSIYNNIEKTILFLLSTNIVEVIGIFVTSLLMADAIFLLPVQILFINLVTDSLPAFALGIEPPENEIMSKPPRNQNKGLLSGAVGTSIIYQGFVQSLIVLVMFTSARWFYGNAVASTMSFLTICLMQIVHAINCKTQKSLLKINVLNNKFFTFSFIFLLGLILCVASVPVFMNLFGLVVLSFSQWLIVAITSLSIVPLVEIGKIFIK